MKVSKTTKIIAIAVALVVVIIVASLAAAGIVALDVFSTFATGSEKLTPDGTAAGKALVVYDPGVSGIAKDAATKIANGLRADGYEVVLAGIKSTAAADVSGYDVIVAGGPVYAGKVGSSVYAYLDGLQAPDDVKIGAFATGKYRSENKVERVFPGAAAMEAVLLLYPDEDDVNTKCAGFVADLLR